MRTLIIAALAVGMLPSLALAESSEPMSYGQRPFYLIDKLEDGALKDKLLSCVGQTPSQTAFSIGHRGAPLMFPEHTVESNIAAARQGAGVLECDVTFTADKELVCRHAQNDLHTTTDMVASDLAPKCTTPFTPANGDTAANAECRTSDITLAEFRTLTPKMDAADKTATSADAYLGGTADWRTTLYTDDARTMTHAESIALFKRLGAKFTPELKSPSVAMPFDGFSQEDYAQKLIDEYKAAGIPASDVFAQSFNLDDVLYWIKAEPEFGAQAVFLVEPDSDAWDGNDPATWTHQPAELADMGVNYLAPALFMMMSLDADGNIVPSRYAEEAKAAGLKLIAWTLERSGPLKTGGGWYYQSITDAIDNDADYYNVLHVLAQDVGVEGVFSDWPATVTYYANCFGK
ncbi:glycerophosphodiester phosphodiesterase family protein [Gymnodinialimonas sp.]